MSLLNQATVPVVHPDRLFIDGQCDTIYGLNASVFTEDVDRAREVAGQLRRAPSATTRSVPTSVWPSAGSSRPALVVKETEKVCFHTSRPRASSSKTHQRATTWANESGTSNTTQ